ncbi:hypothetical protein G6F62_003485 [Rhizopus arrhizus]|nr:hypothetical protein G6F62_003485 [Rhizopus arrhizus]KAG1375234.1 hypothetical protein G6F61_008642 [Rhizopus arrhizus]KAG1397331.1 hypothetical protein G6F60_009075 [Rhizopus arrhizus]
MNYPENLIIVPLENKVLLPSTVLRLTLRGKEAAELAKAYFKHVSSTTKGILEHTYIACIPLRPCLKTKSPVDLKNSIAIQAPQVPLGSSSQERPGRQEEDGLVVWKDRERLTEYGCLARITRVQRSGTNLFGVFVEGLERFKVVRLFRQTPTSPPYWMARVSYGSEEASERGETFRMLCEAFVTRIRELNMPETLVEQLSKAVSSKPPSQLADLLVSLLETTFEERLRMLSTPDLDSRLRMANDWIMRQMYVLRLTNTIGSNVEGQLSKRQREFYLRQQLEAIQVELKQGPEEEDELSYLHKRLAQARLPNEALLAAQREMRHLKHLQPSSAEWGVSRNYLDWLANLPWQEVTRDRLDIQKARQVLDGDHFGLESVKKRIIEYLSVIKIKGDLKAPILCLVGPPGVGKTSLGRSIAKSMSRRFHRISLGGVRDEATIRGHRRTYVGSMPGLIVQGLRKCKVKNPLFLLDEIDKLVNSKYSGDPAAALLEVLDPEQNNAFSDHYLNISFDLSDVLFIATANSLDTIPGPLLDRMEVIEIHGYTFEEKLYIAKKYLIPKQIVAHGLERHHINLSDDTVLHLAEGYTRESGVRNLERTIASVVRAKCVQLAELKESEQETSYDCQVAVKDVQHILGNTKFEKEIFEHDPCAGVVTGLAYSASGQGGILLVEAMRMPGYGKLYLTGSLGSVLQESAQIAFTWLKANAFVLGLTSDSKGKLAEEDDIHIHIPHGSVPKDGPSAGITLLCALVSLYSNRHVSCTIAMSGEISLRGQVLPVGGIKEKIISAYRSGIRKVIIPFKNKVDVETDIPETIRAGMAFCYVQNAWQMLDAAFDNEQWSKLSRQHVTEGHL